MTHLHGAKRAWAVFIVWAALVLDGETQVFTKLVDFDGTNGANPLYVSLIQGHDGNLYGTTEYGGAKNEGTFFGMTLTGALKSLYSFCTQENCDDGYRPSVGLALADGGDFYGAVYLGGANGFGTLFKATPSGKLTTVHSFDYKDGAEPSATLVEGMDGSFYGVTIGGGNPSDAGTVFKINSEGVLATLYQFNSIDGAEPIGGLIQSADGSLYGTTFMGGFGHCDSGCGTIFKITREGRLTTLHTFDLIDGARPLAALIQTADGNLYGTTYQGGNRKCEVGCGTIFKITPRGMLTTPYFFDETHGVGPAGLVLGTDGNLYGVTLTGGAHGFGTVFRFTKQNKLTTLHSFNNTDGAFPLGTLVEDTNGLLYGTTESGGTHDSGVIYSLDVGLHPFVRIVRDSGKVGGSGAILGQGLTGTTGVFLNGTPVDFRVASDACIRGTVPAGAISGFVTVTTPSGTLTSSRIFRVRPQLLEFEPPSGPAGTQVTITGVSLTQTLGIGFGNRVPAQFTVNSDTQVTATVPAGAKTGRIGIETKGGVAISAGTFTVTK